LIMTRRILGTLALALSVSAGSLAQAEPQGPGTPYDDLIARLAQSHGVPADFVHRVVKRESRYNPSAYRRQCYGLMQIKHATARAMGYRGSPQGLLDPEVNLTYGVPYLANAWRLAGGDPDRAIKLYSGGYYYFAKQHNLLGELRTAASLPEPAAAPPHPPEPRNPFAQVFSYLTKPNP
jgi:soluble lytic murein transglycosylase-like protein